ncbi:hypothetical protein [Pseudoduganella namucuonensis]|uniref:HEPN domain-containing protein n=1 Tax=Pseudoduganella namucuonensis TaxID=1035707 RepID=A0A1I7EZD1_9BURK|nr:hypothetical protein [Pseudoduganella namucuonensis]SFU29254.1 hypothetical protein SAMN05216552_1001263 [Pseudoduganella namucuonensis]
MNRYDFQRLSDIRIREAGVLLDAGCYAGSYYLAGYAVECALKACVAQTTRRYEFPNKALANQVHTRKLEVLLTAAGLAESMERMASVNKPLFANWERTLAWNETARYSLHIKAPEARKLYDACGMTENGVLPWLKIMW